MENKRKKKLKKQNKFRKNRHFPKTGLESSEQPESNLQSDITEDIVYFFRSFPDSMRSPQMATEALIKAVLPTEKIAMEPEFDDIVGDPINCVSVYSETINKMEVNWKSFGDLPPQLAESIRLQLMEETIRGFLNESLRSEILEGLNSYRLRKKRAGDKKEAGIAAAIQLVLKDEKNNPLWPKIGLLHRIVHSSIALGLEIKKSYDHILNKNKMDLHENTELMLSDDPLRPEILQKISSKLQENPKLNNFINRQTKRIHEEGIQALLEGKLYFGFLTMDDLNNISERIVRVTGLSKMDQLNNANVFLSGLTAKKQKKLLADIDIFLNETFTSEKIEQMLQKLNSTLNSPGDLKKWVPFIFMIRNSLQADDAMESRKDLFKCITLGELSAFQGDPMGY